MTPQAAAALRCPVCGGALMPLGTSLRCPQGHSYDMAKEGYVNLLAIQRRHAADPGDGKAMVRARRAFLQAGYYAPFQKALAELCLEYAPECGETHLLDAGCGEGSYDRVVYDAFAAQGRPCVLAGFDLSKDAIRLAAKLLPEAAFAVGGSFSAPVRDGWADVLLNIFSPFAGQEFCRVLRSGGVLLYAVPTARHLYGLKEVLYDEPYENAEQQTEYSGFTLIGERTVTDTITVEGDQIRNLFAMTPYFWKTPHNRHNLTRRNAAKGCACYFMRGYRSSWSWVGISSAWSGTPVQLPSGSLWLARFSSSMVCRSWWASAGV